MAGKLVSRVINTGANVGDELIQIGKQGAKVYIDSGKKAVDATANAGEVILGVGGKTLKDAKTYLNKMHKEGETIAKGAVAPMPVHSADEPIHQSVNREATLNHFINNDSPVDAGKISMVNGMPKELTMYGTGKDMLPPNPIPLKKMMPEINKTISGKEPLEPKGTVNTGAEYMNNWDKANPNATKAQRNKAELKLLNSGGPQ